MQKYAFNRQYLSQTHGGGSGMACGASPFYPMAALHGDVTSILQTERIAPEVQTLLPFDVPTFQDDDTP